MAFSGFAHVLRHQNRTTRDTTNGMKGQKQIWIGFFFFCKQNPTTTKNKWKKAMFHQQHKTHYTRAGGKSMRSWDCAVVPFIIRKHTAAYENVNHTRCAHTRASCCEAWFTSGWSSPISRLHIHTTRTWGTLCFGKCEMRECSLPAISCREYFNYFHNLHRCPCVSATVRRYLWKVDLKYLNFRRFELHRECLLTSTHFTVV